jgi:hypothetical protein
MQLQRESGFSRAHDARQFSADWRTYFASSAYAHRWMLQLIGRWTEVLFPGFVALAGGVGGWICGWRARGRLREISILYGGLAAAAFWASLGPDAGMYRVLNALLPAFSFMRAPSRFGMLVAFSLSVLTGVAIAALLSRIQRAAPGQASSDARSFSVSRSSVVAVLIGAVVVLELFTALSFSRVPPVNPAYRLLTRLPRGPVIELPFYSWRFASARTEYVLNSTVHWMPLVNGYSSYTPPDFMEKTPILGGFPSREAFEILEADRVKYALFHMDRFSPDARADLVSRLEAFDRHLRRLYADQQVWLYEIVEFP